MRIGVLKRDADIVVLPDCLTFLFQLEDLVYVRATAVVTVRVQKDEFTLVRRLKMWAVDEHDEMEWVRKAGTVSGYHRTAIATPGTLNRSTGRSLLDLNTVLFLSNHQCKEKQRKTTENGEYSKRPSLAPRTKRGNIPKIRKPDDTTSSRSRTVCRASPESVRNTNTGNKVDQTRGRPGIANMTP
jgi:hypothetical protein